MKLLLLHGWGMHGDIWGDWVDAHEPALRWELPGHGRRARDETMGPLTDLAAEAAAAVDAPTTWLGWSLGGLIAMRAALDYPEKVRALVLVCATPSFLTRPGWPHGMDPAVFREFGAGLDNDDLATLQRFAALEVHGSATARADLRAIRRRMQRHPPPARRTLKAALALLERTDLRGELAAISVPTMVVGGSHDRLVAPGAVRATAARLPKATVHLIDGAGHAPFLAQANRFAALVDEFLDNSRRATRA